MNYAFLLLFTFSSCNYVISTKLPADYQRCDRGDSNFNTCLREAISGALHKLADGDKSLGIPSLEPIQIPSAIIREGTGAVHVVQKFTNLILRNLTTSKIISVTSTATKNTFLFTANVTSPEYILEADYDFNGRLMVFPIVGTGKSKINLYNVNTMWSMSGEYAMKNGQQYLDVTDFTISLVPGKVLYRFENLFNGNQELSKQIHTVLNENWKEVFYDVKTGYEELIATVGKTYATQLFSRVPVKNIFL